MSLNKSQNKFILLQKSAGASTEGSSDARANLMEAIRQAGGSGKAQLRSAKDIKIEAKKKKMVSFVKCMMINSFLR